MKMSFEGVRKIKKDDLQKDKENHYKVRKLKHSALKMKDIQRKTFLQMSYFVSAYCYY